MLQQENGKAMAPAWPGQAMWQDLTAMAGLWRLVGALAWMDIRLRYRGSWLGPFWLSLSTAVMVAALGVLYPLLLHLPAADYVPYLAVSLILWNALAQLVTDATGAFVQQEAVILAIRLPFSVHVARVLLRNLLALAHQGVVLIPVFLLFGTRPGATAWTILPALALWALDGFALILALGAVSARFRDIPPIMASVMQLAFFLTPVIWQAAQLGQAAQLRPAAIWLTLNPLHAMLDILRAPLLGQPTAPASWLIALGASALGVAGAAGIFAWAHRRLAFWL